MVGIAATFLLRPDGAAPPISPAPPPVSVVAPATPAQPAAPLSGFMRQGLEAAQNGAAGEAAALFRKATEADGTDAEAWNNLGVTLARQGDWSDALDAFRKAVRLKPEHAEARRNLAVALDRRGASSEAVQHYRAFLTRSPKDHPDRGAVSQRLADLAPSAAPKAVK